MDEAWRDAVRTTPEQRKKMTATFTVGEKDMMKKDMAELTKSYYDAVSYTHLTLPTICSV